MDTISVVNWLVSVMANVATYLAQIVGQIIILLIGMIAVPLMQYDKFVTSPVVGMGWSIVRDAVNMFFVIILIIIAFGTILGVERFKWRQQIPGILIMAVVINFSRTLCGLLIDFSQIIMLTFVNAIKDIAGGNFIQMFQLKDIMGANSTAGALFGGSAATGPHPFDIFGAALIALLMMLIVLVSLTFFTIALAYRIVLLWALVITAPLAWFFKPVQSILGMKKNPYTVWWSKFTCALQLGPILVFFLWLALAVAGSGDISTSAGFSTAGTLDTGSLSGMMQPGRMVSFIVGVMLLMVGLDAANDVCAGADGVMSGLMGKARGLSKGLIQAPVNLAAWGTKKGAKTIWSGSSGGGGIKGRVLGSKAVTSAAQVLGQAPILRFLGGSALAQVVGKNRIESKAKREKFDQDRASTTAKAGGFKDKSEAELQGLLHSDDPATARAATQAMADKGLFKDNPSLGVAERKQRIDNIKKARTNLKGNPDALETFDDKIRKQSPGFALDTIYRDAKGAIDQKKLREDINNLKIGAGAILSSTNSGNVADVKTMMGGNAEKRMEFMHDIFDGNVKNMTAAIGGIDDTKVREALFGDIKGRAAQIATFAQKDEINATTGLKTGNKVADYDKMNAILSSLVSNGIDVGDVNEYYKDRRAPGSTGISYDKDAAKKAMAKHVGSNADSYKETFDDMSDSKDVAVQNRAKDQLRSIFTEVGDIISGEGIAKLRNGGTKLKGNVDEAMNISLVAGGTSLSAAAGTPQYNELKIKLENAVERAVKGGAGIDLVGAGFTGLNPGTQKVIIDEMANSKIEDLHKMTVAKGSETEVGKLMWAQMSPAVADQIMKGSNRKLQAAIRATKTCAAATNPANVVTYDKIKEFL